MIWFSVLGAHVIIYFSTSSMMIGDQSTISSLDAIMKTTSISSCEYTSYKMSSKYKHITTHELCHLQTTMSKSKAVSRIPVVGGGACVGMISARTTCRHLAAHSEKMEFGPLVSYHENVLLCCSHTKPSPSNASPYWIILEPTDLLAEKMVLRYYIASCTQATVNR